MSPSPRIRHGSPRSGQWAGRETAGTPTRRPRTTSIIRQIKIGYPVAAFDRLKDDLGLNLRQLARVSNISLPTVHRRKVRSERFSPEESERIFRLRRLYETAFEVFEDRAAVRTWLATPRKAFEGKTALEYADTQPGTEEVERVLRRMEHGVVL
jgi:putative toxin-antitoxin system antitoxin component (TIGR02293 family)